MILHCSISFFFMLFTLVLSGCVSKDTSSVSDGEADIIRQILRVNGVSINADESVDIYLDIHSSSEHADNKDGEYYIILPIASRTNLILTDEVTKLSKFSDRFSGIVVPEATTSEGDTGNLDTLIIKTDSVIILDRLILRDNKLRTLPSEIGKLRTSFLSVADNKITQFPLELMQLSESPIYYDTIKVDVYRNSLDILEIEEPLQGWLLNHLPND